MRDVQTYGRQFLYAVLLLFLFVGLQNQPTLSGVALAILVVGVPGYWFWTLSMHRRHHQEPLVSCQHCRVRLAEQLKSQDQERMAQVNRKYSA